MTNIINFPASPSVNDTHTADGVTYICVSTSPNVWNVQVSSGGGGPFAGYTITGTPSTTLSVPKWTANNTLAWSIDNDSGGGPGGVISNFSTTTAYSENDLVVSEGRIWRARQSVAASTTLPTEGTNWEQSQHDFIEAERFNNNASRLVSWYEEEEGTNVTYYGDIWRNILQTQEGVTNGDFRIERESTFATDGAVSIYMDYSFARRAFLDGADPGDRLTVHIEGFPEKTVLRVNSNADDSDSGNRRIRCTAICVVHPTGRRAGSLAYTSAFNVNLTADTGAQVHLSILENVQTVPQTQQIENNTDQLDVTVRQDARRDGQITSLQRAVQALQQVPGVSFDQIDADGTMNGTQNFAINQRHRYLEHNWLAHNRVAVSDIPLSEPFSSTPSNIQLRTGSAGRALAPGLIAELNLAQQRDSDNRLVQIDFEAMSATHSGIYSLRLFRAGADVAGRPAVYHTNLLPFGSGIDQNSGFEFAQFDRNSDAAAVHVIRVENISTNTVARAFALANGISLGTELTHTDYARLVNAIINSSDTRESNGGANALAGDYTFTSNNVDQSHPFFITTSTDNGVAPTIGRIRFIPIGTSVHTPRLENPDASMVLFQQGVGDSHTDPVQIAFLGTNGVDQSAGELLLFRVTATDHADTTSPGNIAAAEWLSDYIGTQLLSLPANRRYDFDDYEDATAATIAASDSFHIDSGDINEVTIPITDLSAANETALETALRDGEVWIPINGSQTAISNSGSANATTLAQIIEYDDTDGSQSITLNMNNQIQYDGNGTVSSTDSFITEIDGARALFLVAGGGVSAGSRYTYADYTTGAQYGAGGNTTGESPVRPYLTITPTFGGTFYRVLLPTGEEIRNNTDASVAATVATRTY